MTNFWTKNLPKSSIQLKSLLVANAHENHPISLYSANQIAPFQPRDTKLADRSEFLKGPVQDRAFAGVDVIKTNIWRFGTVNRSNLKHNTSGTQVDTNEHKWNTNEDR